MRNTTHVFSLITVNRILLNSHIQNRMGYKNGRERGKFWRDLRSLSVVYYKFYYNMIYYLGGLLSVV